MGAALVAQGSTDAFAGAGFGHPPDHGHRHRGGPGSAAGGAVVDTFGGPSEIDPDLSRRWSGVDAGAGARAGRRRSRRVLTGRPWENRYRKSGDNRPFDC